MRAFEIANQLLTPYSLNFAPGMNANVRKVFFIMFVRCLYNKQNNTYIVAWR